MKTIWHFSPMESEVTICRLSTQADMECGDGLLIAGGIRDVMNGKIESFEFEYPCHSPDEQRWVSSAGHAIQNPGPTRVVIAHENVTKLRQALDLLRDADRRKDEFLATLAHELRNPLAPYARSRTSKAPSMRRRKQTQIA